MLWSLSCQGFSNHVPAPVQCPEGEQGIPRLGFPRIRSLPPASCGTGRKHRNIAKHVAHPRKCQKMLPALHAALWGKSPKQFAVSISEPFISEALFLTYSKGASSGEARRTPIPALLVAPPTVCKRETIVSQFCMGEVLFLSRGLLLLE